MNNKQLNKIIPNAKNINQNIEISSITFDSREVGAGSLFIAIKGYKSDGHEYIESSINSGAAAVLYQIPFDISSLKQKYPDVIFIESEDTRKAMPVIASKFYNEPTKDANIIAVCGTNGKTTPLLKCNFPLRENLP